MVSMIETSAPILSCKEVQCEKCHLKTWWGCGKHVDSVMKNIPEAERCQCPRD